MRVFCLFLSGGVWVFFCGLWDPNQLKIFYVLSPQPHLHVIKKSDSFPTAHQGVIFFFLHPDEIQFRLWCCSFRIFTTTKKDRSPSVHVCMSSGSLLVVVLKMACTAARGLFAHGSTVPSHDLSLHTLLNFLLPQVVVAPATRPVILYLGRVRIRL